MKINLPNTNATIVSVSTPIDYAIDHYHNTGIGGLLNDP